MPGWQESPVIMYETSTGTDFYKSKKVAYEREIKDGKYTGMLVPSEDFNFFIFKLDENGEELGIVDENKLLKMFTDNNAFSKDRRGVATVQQQTPTKNINFE
jgi:hypothetical protein